jgi:hypothetical protein
MERSNIFGVDTRASVRQAVVLTVCPTSPAGIDGDTGVADSRACGVAGWLLGAEGFSAAGVGASEGRWVEKLL